MEAVKTVVARRISTRNLMILAAIGVTALIVPLGSEWLLGGVDRHYLPVSSALSSDTLLIWLHFFMDMMIGLSYVAISTTLGVLAWKARRDIPFLWMFVAFGAFIITCGFTHFAAMWTLWEPAFYMAGTIKLLTAVASVVTAIALPRLIPQALRLIEVGKISEFRRKELERLNQILSAEQRELMQLNASKDEFISLASHQLRTPATGVKQYVNLLREGFMGQLTPKQQSLLDKAHESNERQLAVINELLSTARIDTGQLSLDKSRFDIASMAVDVVQEQAKSFRDKNQHVDVSRPDKPLMVMADPKHLRMVLENLISNAGKYTPEDKRISVTVERRGNTVRVTVSDEGVGISPADTHKLFQKFSRIKNPLSHVGGNGLGLYWAKKVVDLHKGTIAVDSKPGVGTSFTITLSIS